MNFFKQFVEETGQLARFSVWNFNRKLRKKEKIKLFFENPELLRGENDED